MSENLLNPEIARKRINESKILFLAFFLLNVYSVQSQFTWSRILGEPMLNEISWKCLTLKDSNFLIVGEKWIRYNNSAIQQSYLVKYDRKGRVLWQKTFGDSVSSCYAYSAVEDPLGNIYLSSNWSTPRLIKIDQFGNLLWQRSYGYPILEFGGIQFVDENKNLLMISQNDSSGILLTAGLTKVDSSGNFLWTRNYNDSLEYEVSYDGFLATPEGYYMVGRRLGTVSNSSFYMKVDTSGIVLWKKFTSIRAIFFSICQNSNKSFIAVGNRPELGTLFCLKFDIAGDTIWQRNYNAESVATGVAIVKTFRNDFVIATSAYTKDAKIVFIDSLGNLSQVVTHNYSHSDAVYYQSIDNASDSGYIISGYIEQNESGTVDFLTVKTNKLGNTTPIGIVNQNEIVKNFKLGVKIFPNPFNSQTIMEIETDKPGFVELKLFDLSGREITIIYKGYISGPFKFHFLAEQYSLASGIYFLKVGSIKGTQNDFITKKIVYIK